MASSYTEGLVIELIGSGDKAGSWGDVTNNNLKSLNQGITGFSEVDLSGASDPHLIDLSDAQVPDESTSPSRSSIIKFINVPDTPTPFRINFQVNTAPAQRINCVVINGDDNNTISVGTGANGDRLTILNGYAASVYSEVNSGNSSYFDIKNSLANLAVDKIALENNEIIGNATDDKITISASTLEIGDDGTSVAVIQNTGTSSADADLLLRSTSRSGGGFIRIGNGTDENIEVDPADNGALAVTGPIAATGNISTSGSGSITAANGLNVTAGGAAITGTSSVTGSLAVSSLDAGSGTIETTGTLSGGTTSVGGLTATSLNLSSGNITNAGTINSGAITSSGSIGGTSINVGSGTIDGGAITGTSLSAGSGTIGGGAITGTSLTVGTGASNTITAGELICDDLSHATSITSTISSSNKFRVDSNGAQVVATNGYLNMSSTSGSAGFGLRNNSGTLEIKNSTSGGWGSIAVLSGSDLSVSGSLTAGTSVTAGSTVTAGTGLTVSSGGASISGGLNNNSGGITNAGAITCTSLDAGSGTIETTALVIGGIIAATTSVGAPSVTGTTSVATPTLTSNTTNQNLTVSPNGTGRIILESSSTSSNQGTEAIHINASAGRIGLQVESVSDHVTIRIPISSAPTTPVLQAMFNDEGLLLHEAGGGYLNFSSSTGSAGNGFRADTSDDPVEFRAKRTDASDSDNWGRIYHSGMVSGDGAFFESTCAVTANTEQNLTTGFSAIPSLVTTYLECTTADAGYSVGDHVKISSSADTYSTANTGIAITFDGAASNDVTVSIGSNGLGLIHKTSNTETLITESSWRLRVKAWK